MPRSRTSAPVTATLTATLTTALTAAVLATGSTTAAHAAYAAEDAPKVTITSNSLIENDLKATVKLACSAGVGKCKGRIKVRSKAKVQVGQAYKAITVIESTRYKGDPERQMKLKLLLTKDARTALAEGAYEVVIEVTPAGDGKAKKKTVTLNP